MNRLATATRAPEPDAPPVLDLVCERVVLRVRRRLAWVRHLEHEEADPLARLGLDLPAHESRFYAASDELAGLQRRLAAVEAELDACLLQDAWDNPCGTSSSRSASTRASSSCCRPASQSSGPRAGGSRAAAHRRPGRHRGARAPPVRSLPRPAAAAPRRAPPLAPRHRARRRARVPALLQLDPQVTGWLIGQVSVPPSSRRSSLAP
ncbi:hypothetical protein [Nannocystis pusilla]|uniref:hypothetical protein n=1 Tax=Nannocystis pusilla TaxID=889268 RepID=UPI003B7E0ED1